jgi:hypothetical protein
MMKTLEEIMSARDKIRQCFISEKNTNKRCILSGISITLCWVCDDPNGSTLDRLLAGEEKIRGDE